MLFFEKSENYLCTFKVTIGNRVQSFTTLNNRTALEEHFELLVNKAAISKTPSKIEMLLSVSIFDETGNCCNEFVNSLVFTNKAWNDWNGG